MTSLFVSPTDLFKAYRFVQRTVQATETGPDGSIARFDDIEEQLRQFKAAINRCRTVPTPPDEGVDAALRECENAIKILDNRLQPYRAVFSKPDVRKRKRDGWNDKVKFAKVIEGFMREYDAKVSRGLWHLEVNRVTSAHVGLESSKPQIQENPVLSMRVTSLELQMEELKRLCSPQVASQSKQIDTHSWNGSDVTVCNTENGIMRWNSGGSWKNVHSNGCERFNGIPPRRYTKINNYTNKSEHCVSMVTPAYNAQSDSDSDEIENADAGTRIGTALGHIVKGVINLLDVCIERPRFSLWYSTGVDWKELERGGLRIDPARPYRNTLLHSGRAAVLYLETLRYKTETLVVEFRSPADEYRQSPSNKGTSSAQALVYGYCRDRDGVWIVDAETAKPEAYPTIYNNRQLERFYTRQFEYKLRKSGHIRIHFSLNESFRVYLRFRGSEFWRRYSSCIRDIERFKLRYQHSDLPGEWPGEVETNEGPPSRPSASLCLDQPQPRRYKRKATSQTSSSDHSRFSEKLDLLTSIDPDNGEWLSCLNQRLAPTVSIGEIATSTRQRKVVESPDGTTSLRFFEREYLRFMHSPSDSFTIYPIRFLGAMECNCATECSSKQTRNICSDWLDAFDTSFDRIYDINGKPTSELQKTLYTIYCDIRVFDEYGRYLDSESMYRKMVATRQNWNEKVKILIDDSHPAYDPEFFEWLSRDPEVDDAGTSAVGSKGSGDPSGGNRDGHNGEGPRC